MTLHPMATAPRTGLPFMILTAYAGHHAEWDRTYLNFWSNTSARALTEDEMLGWMTIEDWRFMVAVKERVS